MPNSDKPGQEASPHFQRTMRGYEPGEVDAFLARVADDPDLPVPRATVASQRQTVAGHGQRG